MDSWTKLQFVCLDNHVMVIQVNRIGCVWGTVLFVNLVTYLDAKQQVALSPLIIQPPTNAFPKYTQ